MIFWVISFFFTLRMGYTFLIGKPFFPYVSMVLACALIGMLVYVIGGLSTFRERSELWAFEIPWFFLANKFALLTFFIAIIAHFFGGQLVQGDLAKAVIVVVLLAVTSGSLIGSFSASAFMKKYNITQTY